MIKIINMNKRYILLVVFFGITLLFSCEKEQDNQDLITFEELIPDSTGYWNGSDGSGSFKIGNISIYKDKIL